MKMRMFVTLAKARKHRKYKRLKLGGSHVYNSLISAFAECGCKLARSPTLQLRTVALQHSNRVSPSCTLQFSVTLQTYLQQSEHVRKCLRTGFLNSVQLVQTPSPYVVVRCGENSGLLVVYATKFGSFVHNLYPGAHAPPSAWSSSRPALNDGTIYPPQHLNHSLTKKRPLVLRRL
jgi:hypothetical protein